VPLPAFMATALQRLATGALARAAAISALAVAAIAIGLLALGVIEMSTRDPAPVASPTAQAGAQPTPEPETLGAPLAGPISDGMVRRSLQSDETPDEQHGIALVDVETGEGELWSLPVSGGAFVVYEASPNHRWLAGLGSGPVAEAVIVDRQTDEQYRLDWEAWEIAAGPNNEGILLLRAQHGSGDLRVINLAIDPTGPGRQLTPPALTENWGRAAVVLGDGEHALIDGQVVDLATGAVLHTVWQHSGAITVVSLTRLDNGGALAVVFTGDRGAPDISTFRVDASGNLTGQQVFFAQRSAGAGFGQTPSPDGVRASPDGRWLAWQSRLTLGSVPFSEYWPAVVIADLQSGEVVMRIVRASVREGGYFGDEAGGRSAWLSDSSGLVLKTDGGSALLRIEGDGALEPLPFAGEVPVPAVHESGVLVHDGRLVSLEGDALSSRWGIGDWPLGDPLDAVGFSEDGDEVRFVKVIPPGRDWTVHILDAGGLPALLQRPPFTEVLRVQVAAAGDGLNLRATPTQDGEVIATLPDGTVATVTAGPEEFWGVTTSSVPDQAEIDAGTFWWQAPWWVHVRTEAGLEGWVSAQFLAWAE
jgi:hypothetical protein